MWFPNRTGLKYLINSKIHYSSEFNSLTLSIMKGSLGSKSLFISYLPSPHVLGNECK